jgi:uncharacterized protein
MSMPVTHLILWITENCNLRCDYCFVEKSEKRMSLDVGRAAIDFLLKPEVSWEERSLRITFFGGEPLLEFDTIEGIVEYWKSLARTVNKKMSFTLTTNGTLLTKRMADFFKANDFAIQYSMDGTEDASWRRCFPNGQSAYEAARRNIRRARSAVKRLRGRMTVTRDRLNLRENARHLLDEGFDAAVIVPRVEDSWNKYDDASTLRNAFKDLADWYMETARSGRILPLDITNIYIHRYQASLNGAPRPENPCGIGRRLLGVDTEGHLMPCHHWLNKSHWWLGDLWGNINQERKDSFEHFTSGRFRGCASCTASSVCAGPCMGLAEQFGGDMARPLLGHCLFTQAHIEAVKYIYHTLTMEGNTPFQRFLTFSEDFLARTNLDSNR